MLAFRFSYLAFSVLVAAIGALFMLRLTTFKGISIAFGLVVFALLVSPY